MDDFILEEGLDGVVAFHDFVQFDIHVDTFHHILHFVPILAQTQKDNRIRQCLLPPHVLPLALLYGLNTRRAVNGMVTLCQLQCIFVVFVV